MQRLRGIWIFALSVATVAAQSSPIIRLGEGGDKSWSDALADGDIGPYGGPLSGPASAFYGGGSGPTSSSLTPDIPVTDDSTETHTSLIMGWDRSGPGPDVAAFEFLYDDDPDLNGLTVSLLAFPPPGPVFPQSPIIGLGIELIDIDGDSRGWFKRNPFPLWSENLFVFDPSGPAPGLFDFFQEDPGFELDKVLRIRVSEAADPFRPFRDPEPGPPPHRDAWNAWAHLRVVPEPASTTAMLVGIAGIVVARRKRRQM